MQNTYANDNQVKLLTSNRFIPPLSCVLTQVILVCNLRCFYHITGQLEK